MPPIIILQSDTGLYVDLPGRELTKERYMKERMKIFSAYYLPEKDNQLLYETITPVNSFRIVFNLYFDTEYELLEDKSYFGELSELTLVPPEDNAD